MCSEAHRDKYIRRIETLLHMHSYSSSCLDNNLVYDMPSAVWEHFERPERGKDNPVCRHCGKSVKNNGGNTSNLMAHIKTKHFMVYSSLQKKKQHSPSLVRNVVSPPAVRRQKDFLARLVRL